MKKRILFALTTATLFVPCVVIAHPPAEPQRLPRGWKVPQKLESSGCDRTTRDLFTARADFDGDRKQDVAKLLTKENG